MAATALQAYKAASEKSCLPWQLTTYYICGDGHGQHSSSFCSIERYWSTPLLAQASFLA